MKKLILSMILLASFSVVQALEFKSFNFNDESDCAEQLGQLPVSLPYDIINVNHLSKSKEICLQAYTGDNACRKEYHRQKDALGLTSGIRSNHTVEAEQQAQQQCGGWLKGRLSACESFLQQASAVCYQIISPEQLIQKAQRVWDLLKQESKRITDICWNKHYDYNDRNFPDKLFNCEQGFENQFSQEFYKLKKQLKEIGINPKNVLKI